MSLSLLKKTLPADDKLLEELPKKRQRTFEERYESLIQKDIDSRILRQVKPKAKKPQKPSNPKTFIPLLTKIESEIPETQEDPLSHNLQVLKSRKLPSKYISLLQKRT
ncbi:hypothetical protein SteCoe_1852 [Stentor coeruleus]|uniref:Uncharacterized protein n=1 Tax=Stentor coeruleus TaxID=5963 RepID=A0A1R2D0T5_9CILI|nr:hypothetical protein SteCoe_1852 [Stentor coeruleus]